MYQIPNAPAFFGMDDKDLKMYILKTELKLPNKQTAKVLLKIRDYYNSIGNVKIVEFINILIGNTKYHKKIVFVRDGSYRTHRIWIDYNLISVDIIPANIDSISYIYKDMFSISEDYSNSVTALKRIFNSYEKIFIQIPIKRWNELKKVQ